MFSTFSLWLPYRVDLGITGTSLKSGLEAPCRPEAHKEGLFTAALGGCFSIPVPNGPFSEYWSEFFVRKYQEESGIGQAGGCTGEGQSPVSPPSRVSAIRDTP